MKNKILIVGAGITGITLAENLMSQKKRVFIIEKRNHIGGNCYDYRNKDGIIVQKYGPHVFHTNHKDVWQYLSKFTEWIDYEHEVLGFINNKFAPIPFNLDSLEKLFPPKKAKELEEKLINIFGYNQKVPILELKKTTDRDLKDLADFIYKKIFLGYTQKQWGVKPEEIDESVMNRVPVITSRDNRYFQDEYQGIPKNGYTAMFKNMLKNNHIAIKTNTIYQAARDNNNFDFIFYTGPIDEFFNYKFGKLNYRKLKINFKTINKKNYQPSAVVNYPNKKYKFTRITEFKKFYNKKSNKTVIAYEYPGDKGFLAWNTLDEKNKKLLKKYQEEIKKLKNIHFIGRLAEYKYYDMDDAVKNVLNIFKKTEI